MISKVEKDIFMKMNLIIIFNWKNMEAMLFKAQKEFVMKMTGFVKMATFNIMKMLIWKKNFWRLQAVLRNHEVNTCVVCEHHCISRNTYIAKSGYIVFYIVKA